MTSVTAGSVSDDGAVFEAEDGTRIRIREVAAVEVSASDYTFQGEPREIAVLTVHLRGGQSFKLSCDSRALGRRVARELTRPGAP